VDGHVSGLPRRPDRARRPARLAAAGAFCLGVRPTHSRPRTSQATGLGGWAGHTWRLRGAVVDLSADCPRRKREGAGTSAEPDSVRGKGGEENESCLMFAHQGTSRIRPLDQWWRAEQGCGNAHFVAHPQFK
jgi:hypothetical protein